MKIRPLFELMRIPVSRKNITKERIIEILKLYQNLTHVPDADVLCAELEILFDNCIGLSTVNEIFHKCHNLENILPKAFTLCQFIKTAGYSVASNERAFSSLKYIKNPLRSVMKGSKINAQMLLFSEQDFTDSINFCKIVHQWIILMERRVNVKL